MKKPLALEFLVGAQVACVSTNRYLSAAACKNVVQIWGEYSGRLPITASLVACGAKFIVIATENQVLLWGSANYESALAPSEPISIGNFKAVQLSSGLAHALALDTEGHVFSFGCGDKGELGLGPSITSALTLTSIGLNSISKILCHGQISVAVSFNTVYVWGLINPEELESSARKG